MGTDVILDNLCQIVSKFPEVLEYRNSLENYGGRIDRYLMLVGGTITIRDACIDYISSLPFLGIDKLNCSGLNKNTVEQEFLSDTMKAYHLQHQNKEIYNSKLFVLKDIFCFEKSTLDNLIKAIIQSDFLVVTTDSKLELGKLPPDLKRKFKMVDISTNRSKSNRKNFPPKNIVDKLLQKLIIKFPYESRTFIVEKAFPLLQKRFAAKSMYSKNTLMTRVSMLRNRLNRKTTERIMLQLHNEDYY